MTDPYVDEMFDAHIEAISLTLPVEDRTERWLVVDALLDYRNDHPVREATMVVDWLLHQLDRAQRYTYISRETIDNLLSDLRIV